MIVTEAVMTRHTPKERDAEAELKLIPQYRKLLEGKYQFNTSEIPPEDLQKVLMFFAQYHLYKYENAPKPEKGLLITGPAGRGKTMMAKLLALRFEIEMFPMDEIDREYSMNPERCWNEHPVVFRNYETLILDDVGAEAGSKHYGNAPVLSSLLLGLYDRWCNYGKLTIVTTNLTMATGGRVPGVLDVLGERIYSRFNEMFEFVRFNGARDYRRFRPSERITCSNLPER